MSLERMVDDLARAMATPMPRRRAVRVIGSAFAGAWIGGSVSAPRATARGLQTYCQGKAANEGWTLCTQDTEQCRSSCCPPGLKCCIGPSDPTTGCLTAFSCCDPCSPTTATCSSGRCLPGPVAATCGGCPGGCPAGEKCCKATSPTGKGRCYDAKTECCTPGKGVSPKHPMRGLEWCPDRKARPGYTPSANGCGPAGGRLTPFIPNTFLGADFKPACDFHDRCYGTCNRHKGYCDRRFEKLLQEACRSEFKPWNPVRYQCLSQAHTYYQAVSKLGGDAYESAQRKACVCC